MSKNTLLIWVIVIVVVLAAAALYVMHQNAPSPGTVATTTDSAAATGSTGTTGGSAPSGTGNAHFPGSSGGVTITAAPHITKFLPASGTPGTPITIVGTGFSKTQNYIMFGTSAGRHHLDGSPDNQIAVVGSPDGKSLTFTVPASGPSGQLCDNQNQCVAISSIALSSGNYPVTVRTNNKVSNMDLFVLMK